MNWYEFAENPEVILALYEVVPSLKGIDLQTVRLHQENAGMAVYAILSRFVDRPPVQWLQKYYNATLITLDFVELDALHIEKWSTFNFVDATLERTEAGNIQVQIMSSDFSIQAVARSMRITVDAFHQHPLTKPEDYQTR